MVRMLRKERGCNALTKEQAIAIIDHVADRLFALSDSLWDRPEIGYTEKFAKESYCRFLQDEGFEVTENLANIPTAFSGKYGHGKPTIGILAEFDALDGLSQMAGLAEEKPVVPHSPGHGCGHNLLGVGSLGAALAIKAYLEDSHDGTIIFFGCPAEENGSGKSFMAREGVFTDLDMALSWHPGDTNNVSTGSTAANYKVIYHFLGKSAHAAICPELGRSALDAVELMNMGVQFLREHISTKCRIHYAITDAGGDSPGVVQSHASVTYLMRAAQLPMVKDLYERVNDIARGAALMTSTTLSTEFVKACSNILPNDILSKLMQENLERIGPADYSDKDREFALMMQNTMSHKDEYFREVVNEIEDPVLRRSLLLHANDPIYEMVLPYQREHYSQASSDVGDVSWICPVAQISMATMPAGTTMHSWQEVAVGKSPLAKKGMLQASKVIAATAIDVINSPKIVEDARRELMGRRGYQPYISPIPQNVIPKIPNN